MRISASSAPKTFDQKGALMKKLFALLLLPLCALLYAVLTEKHSMKC